MTTLDIYVGPSWEPFTPQTFRANGGGGSHLMMVQFAELCGLMLDQVRVYTSVADRPYLFENENWHSYQHFSSREPAELFINYRRPEISAQRGARNIFWTQDLHHGDAITEEWAKEYEAFVVLSDFHLRRFSERYPFIPKEKFRVIRNGVDLRDFLAPPKPRAKRVVYASAPDRGLAKVVSDWPLILEAEPDAELIVLWPWTPTQVQSNAALCERVRLGIGRLSNATLVGRVNRNRVIDIMQHARCLYYPCNFPETSCVTVMDAACAGMDVVCPGTGALAETAPFWTPPGEMLNNVLLSLSGRLMKAPRDLSRYSFEGIFFDHWVPLLQPA